VNPHGGRFVSFPYSETWSIAYFFRASVREMFSLGRSMSNRSLACPLATFSFAKFSPSW